MTLNAIVVRHVCGGCDCFAGGVRVWLLFCYQLFPHVHWLQIISFCVRDSIHFGAEHVAGNSGENEQLSSCGAFTDKNFEISWVLDKGSSMPSWCIESSSFWSLWTCWWGFLGKLYIGIPSGPAELSPFNSYVAPPTWLVCTMAMLMLCKVCVPL